MQHEDKQSRVMERIRMSYHYHWDGQVHKMSYITDNGFGVLTSHERKGQKKTKEDNTRHDTIESERIK